jgi:hypothetical protein
MQDGKRTYSDSQEIVERLRAAAREACAKTLAETTDIAERQNICWRFFKESYAILEGRPNG